MNPKVLDEVVVVGFGTQKKINLTGVVSTVDTKVLESRPVSQVGQALQGTVPGLNLSASDLGGQLGQSMSEISAVQEPLVQGPAPALWS